MTHFDFRCHGNLNNGNAFNWIFLYCRRDTKIANLFYYLSYFLMIFVRGNDAGYAIPRKCVRSVANVLPMPHTVDLMQGAFAGPPANHARELAVLGGVTIIFAITGAIRYRKKDWT